MDVNRSVRVVFMGVAAAVAGCGGITDSRLPTRLNPTAWTYARPLKAVAACLATGELAADAWGGAVSVNTYGDAPVSPPGRYAIVLNSAGYGEDAVRSESYLRYSCPLGIYGKWQFNAVALSEDSTRVEVIPLELQVHNYDCFYIGHPWGCAIDVKRTTVEEYRMLVSLGRCLDVNDMPTVEHPSGPAPDPKSCK